MRASAIDMRRHIVEMRVHVPAEDQHLLQNFMEVADILNALTPLTVRRRWCELNDLLMHPATLSGAPDLVRGLKSTHMFEESLGINTLQQRPPCRQCGRPPILQCRSTLSRSRPSRRRHWLRSHGSHGCGHKLHPCRKCRLAPQCKCSRRAIRLHCSLIGRLVTCQATSVCRISHRAFRL